MRSAFMLALICGGLLCGGPAWAQDQTLGYQVAAHTAEVHALAIPGRPGHQVGVAAFRGLAIFDGGQIASHQYSGSFDFIDGSGRIQGYASWAFEDGSRLEAAYDGEAKAAANGGVTFTARHTNVIGTGRYAGVRGEGTFTGRRIDILKEGGDIYFRGTLTLKGGSR